MKKIVLSLLAALLVFSFAATSVCHAAMVPSGSGTATDDIDPPPPPPPPK